MRWVRWIPVCAWMAWIFWLSSQESIPPPPGISYTIAAIAGHFALYFILTLLLAVAVGANRRRPSSTIFAAIGIAVFGYALTDEWHQSFVAGRDASVFDIVVDSLGAVVALVVWKINWHRVATT